MSELVKLLKENDPKMEKYLEDHATHYVEYSKLTPGYKPVAKLIEEAKQREIQER